MIFEGFCTKISQLPDRIADQHFISQWYLFDKICRTKLDFVGRFENMEADWRQVCAELGADIALPWRNPSTPADFPMAFSGLLVRSLRSRP